MTLGEWTAREFSLRGGSVSPSIPPCFTARWTIEIVELAVPDFGLCSFASSVIVSITSGYKLCVHWRRYVYRDAAVVVYATWNQMSARLPRFYAYVIPRAFWARSEPLSYHIALGFVIRMAGASLSTALVVETDLLSHGTSNASAMACGRDRYFGGGTGLHGFARGLSCGVLSASS